MALDEDMALLARQPLLSLMERDALRLLAFAAESRILRAGDVLFRAGEPSDGAVLVVSGAIALTAQAVTSKRSLVYHGFITFRGTMFGFALGIVLGVGLALAIVRFRVMDLSVMPWAIISQTVPIVAIAPMILAVSNKVGIDGREVPKAIIAAYLSFFPVLVSMVKGLRAPDQMQLDLLKTWGAGEMQTFRKLRLPASMPYFFASLKVAVAAALVGTIVGELPTGAVEGLGARMLIGSQYGEPLITWAALFASALLAGALILVVGGLERLANRKMGVRG